MPYTERRVLDADAHLMEPAGWLESYVDPSVRDRIRPTDGGDAGFTALLQDGEELLGRRQSPHSTSSASSCRSCIRPGRSRRSLLRHPTSRSRRRSA